MATTRYVNGTVVTAAYLNDVDVATYENLSTVVGTNAITAVGPAGMTAYANTSFEFIATGSNTGAVTINITPLGFAPIGVAAVTKSGTTALVTGDIVTGAAYRIVYDGTRYQLLNPGTGAISLPLSIANGGTSQTTAPLARTALGAAASGAVTASGITMSTARLLGRGTAATGAIEEITVSTGLNLSVGGVLTATASGGITLGTPVATTSGTSIDFTGLPAGIKRLTFSFNSVSTNGTSTPMLQIGPVGGVETTNYFGGASGLQAGVGSVNHSTGFLLEQSWVAATVAYGSIIFTLLDATNNIWSVAGVLGRTDSARTITVGGGKTIAGALSRVRLTTVAGTDTFDLGSVNIAYE